MLGTSFLCGILQHYLYKEKVFDNELWCECVTHVIAGVPRADVDVGHHPHCAAFTQHSSPYPRHLCVSGSCIQVSNYLILFSNI